VSSGTAPAGGAETPRSTGRLRSLYLHIPFCERRCEYCDFVSLAGRGREVEYVAALRTEIRELAARLGRLELDTVFVGGGTPSFVDPGRLAGVLDEVRAGFALASAAEVTLEANPSSTSESRAAAWLEAGFNRVSLGIQSLEPDILSFLGRVHDRERALAAVAEVRSAGFSRISCDLIYAVPELDDARWRATLERVAALGTGHVSAYELTVEAGTPLHASVRRGERPAIDPEAALRQHAVAVTVLAAAGLDQYEVSNFARPGEECRHNLVYWRRGHYLAAGLGAHGHIPGGLAGSLGIPPPPEPASLRYWHGRSLPAYLAACHHPRGGLPIAGWEVVGDAEAEAERVLLGLRLAEGLPVSGSWSPRTGGLVRAGLLWRRGGRVGTTARGQEVLDEVVRRLVA
jgi:oxygen-independent coproporphyrinogen-3 oxidase